ncbi:MAG: BTAD domain-containing putative transcriptional regulator [Actinomycetota bacterium]
MEFRILGSLEVLDEGVPIELGAPKQRAVLAVLLLHPNMVVSTDRLIVAVWGEDAPRTAEHSIQIYVSELRKAFDPDGEILVTQRPGYELRVDTESIDARRFERLVKDADAAQDRGDRPAAAALAAEAIGVWRDAPLVDFAYEDFAQREITRLEELRHRAVAILCESHVHGSKPLEAVPMLRDAIAGDPLREESRRLLMLALFAGGRQADALREFRNYRDTLAEETGLEPSPELLRLEEQILLRDPSLASAVEEVELPVPTERNPYKGLRAFDEGDASDFFGRDELIELLLIASATPLTAVVGPSGSGKSSVVRAGLIPSIRSGDIAGSEDWAVATLLPGRYPFAEFDSMMSRITGVGGSESDPADDASITRTVLRSLPSESAAMLLVIDQFEELFTLTDEITRRAFLRNLVTAIEEPRGRIRIVLTVRADFYDRPLLYPEFAKLFTDNVVNVIPLTPAGIEAAAIGPAQRVGVGFAPDLLAQLVSDMTDQPGALPLFQYTLTELFDERDGRSMTLAAYNRIGGLAGALSRRADAVYDSLGSDEQEMTRDVFLRLVKPTEDRYTRRPVAVLELERIGDAAVVSTVLTRFGEERLLTFDRDSMTGAATVEVSHEALLGGWGRLAQWLEDARFDLAELDGLMVGAAEWETVERDPGYLLSGARLTDYEAWAETTTLTLPPIAGAYLAESVAARRQADKAETERVEREERATRRARVRLWGMLAAVVALVSVVTFVVLTAIANRPPAVAYLFSAAGDEGFADDMNNAVDRAEVDFSLEIQRETATGAGIDIKLQEMIDDGATLILNGLASDGIADAGVVAQAHPDVHFVVPDAGRWFPPEFVEEYPNVSFPIFPVNEASFLIGVVAARTTESGVIGFIGGVDFPVIWEFQAGYEAGVEYVEQQTGEDIEVLMEYLTPGWDLGGFSVPSAGMEAAMGMHARGADVIFSAAGFSGYGATLAAVASSSETGIHRWHIGVDVDEYVIFEQVDPEDLPFPPDVLPFPPDVVLQHILTSMIKTIGVSLYDAIEDYTKGDFVPGVREYGLAEGGVGYTTTGGYIDHLVPELEDLKDRVIAGEIPVPDLPEGYEFPQPPGEE